MKRRLHQPSLAQPEVALAEEQAPAEQRAETACRLAFAIVVITRHQNFFDEVRVADHDHLGQAETDLHQVAVVASNACEQAKRVAAQLWQQAQHATLRCDRANGGWRIGPVYRRATYAGKHGYAFSIPIRSSLHGDFAQHPRVRRAVVQPRARLVEGDRGRLSSSNVAGVPAAVLSRRRMDDRAAVLPGQRGSNRNLYAGGVAQVVLRVNRPVEASVVANVAGVGEGVAELLRCAAQRHLHIRRLRRRDRPDRAIERERPDRVAIQRGHATAIASGRNRDVLGTVNRIAHWRRTDAPARLEGPEVIARARVFGNQIAVELTAEDQSTRRAEA